MKTRLIALLVAVLVLSGFQMPTLSAIGTGLSAEAAQLNVWHMQIINQLEASENFKRYLRAGYTVQEGTANLGYLAANRYEDRNIRFTAGYHHMVIAKCDNDCTDVDLFLYGPGGALIARDTLADDFPIIHFQAGVSGVYTLRVKMETCIAPFGCYWGAIVASK